MNENLIGILLFGTINNFRNCNNLQGVITIPNNQIITIGISINKEIKLNIAQFFKNILFPFIAD